MKWPSVFSYFTKKSVAERRELREQEKRFHELTIVIDIGLFTVNGKKLGEAGWNDELKIFEKEILYANGIDLSIDAHADQFIHLSLTEDKYTGIREFNGNWQINGTAANISRNTSPDEMDLLLGAPQDPWDDDVEVGKYYRHRVDGYELDVEVIWASVKLELNPLKKETMKYICLSKTKLNPDGTYPCSK